MSARDERTGAPRRPPRVLAVSSHPIQYQAPWYRALAKAKEIDFSVLYVQQPNSVQQGHGYGVAFEWDIPLLEGYRWQQVTDLRGRGGLRGFFAAHIYRPLALLRRLDPEVVVLTGWHVWPMIQLLLAARWAGIPVVMRGESNALRARPRWVRALHRLLLLSCAAFLPIGRANRDMYLGYGISDCRLFDAPYFVDNARFVESALAYASRRAELRDGWGVPRDAVCFCYAGKLEPKKRILDLLKALSSARAQAGIHLLVVGNGELLQEAQAFAAQHALPVTFAGFLNQTRIASAYVAADCLVLPSDFGETWGLVVNEAMACGRPAVVSDRVGCAQDLVSPGETGAVFPFGNVDALAQCLIGLSRDPGGLRAMGERARERVLRDYSVDRAAAGTLRAVQYALAPA